MSTARSLDNDIQKLEIVITYCLYVYGMIAFSVHIEIGLQDFHKAKPGQSFYKNISFGMKD